MEPGTLLLAQNKTLDTLAVVKFRQYLDITDLDFDNESITYKFVVGVLPLNLIDRLAESEQKVQETLKAVKAQQIANLRAQALAMLNVSDLKSLSAIAGSVQKEK